MYEYRLLDDGDSLWVFNVNLTCQSLKGILFLWKDDEDFERETSEFHNPNVNNVRLKVKGELTSTNLHVIFEY